MFNVSKIPNTKQRTTKTPEFPKKWETLTQKNRIEGLCDWWSVLSFPKLEWLGAEGVTWCYNYYFFKTTLWFWNHTKTQIQKQKIEVQKLQIQIHCVSGGQRRTLVGLSRGRRQRRLFASPDLHSLFCRLLSSQLLYFRAQIRKYTHFTQLNLAPFQTRKLHHIFQVQSLPL